MIRVARSADDFALCAEINNAVNPDHPVAAEELALAPGSFLVHGTGYAYVNRSSIPGSAFAAVRVRPDSRRRGVGGSLLRAAGESARELGCTSMRTENAGRPAVNERLGYRPLPAWSVVRGLAG